MDSQELEELEGLLPVEPIQLTQPSTSRRRVPDEAEPSDRRIRPRLDSSSQQRLFSSLQPASRSLVIVLEAESLLSGGHQLVIEGCFENNGESQMVTRLSDQMGHRLWLQGPLNHLTRERRSIFITALLHRSLEFLYV
ncbi:MAG: hypothetical protein ACRDL7_15820 [Gaiellaceae bacterium]